MYKRSLFWWTLLSFISGYCYRANAQSAYQINLDIPDKIIETGYLDLGGVAPDGGSISVNSYYMELNESPFIPIMGEIHYTRIPNEQWEEQILKVKSGGVNVICTYVSGIFTRKQKVFLIGTVIRIFGNLSLFVRSII